MASLPNEAVYEKEKSRVSWPKQLNDPLEVVDPEIANIIELEKARQWKGLELIPSKNFTSVSVMQAVNGQTNMATAWPDPTRISKWSGTS
ncbi:serine hydroxymethyltransferase, mitochondrial-like [Rhododendron vialii]|uniref:serine hydroxymethyltransferase, mitochondrial-like n=1 Tax=Rhododendron vialii TaxID=182163 RepID=UPI00265E30DC|nr:serine hydroxymethyltransferase, mitochondrial-like [Rhododendron vialii]